jgi:hypothetical protein
MTSIPKVPVVNLCERRQAGDLGHRVAVRYLALRMNSDGHRSKGAS